MAALAAPLSVFVVCVVGLADAMPTGAANITAPAANTPPTTVRARTDWCDTALCFAMIFPFPMRPIAAS
jgi:hypothetical protein